MQLVGLAAHGLQPLARRIQRSGLGDQAAVKGQGLIRAQHPGGLLITRNGQGLGFRKTNGEGGGVQVGRHGLDGVLVHIGDAHLKGDAGVFQHGAAGRALGRQDESSALKQPGGR